MPGEVQKPGGRFYDLIYDDHATIEFGTILEKQNCYQQMLEDMIVDQWQWIKDHKPICVIDSNNAIDSLKIAEEATDIAEKFSVKLSET